MEELRIQHEINLITKTLKKLLVSAQDFKFIGEIHNEYTRCNNQLIQQFFMRLFDKHRDLDKADTQKINKTLTKSCDTNKLFSVFIKRVEDAMKIAEAASYPHTSSQIVAKTFNAIKK